MTDPLVISISILQKQSMQAHLEKCLPEEGCGFIGGRHNQASLIIPVTNSLHSPTQFLMDAHEELSAFLQLEKMGMDLIASFHSHPDGSSQPSQTDIYQNALGNIPALIWAHDLTGWQVRAYNLESHPPQEVECYWMETT
jgi:[CysO sulfur-carrier protein]-S-L-cysteine hydrolase